jgi:hypothetical protein
MILTGDQFARLLLGHLVGDYLLQNNWMALNKKKRIWVAAVHCAIWTAGVVAFVPELLGVVPTAAVFASHLLLDATDIVDRWLKIIRGRCMESVLAYTEQDHSELHKRFYVAYTALVQAVADNALHLLFLYLICRFLVR